WRLVGLVVGRDGPAQHHPAVVGQPAEDRVEYRTTGVVEVHVDPLRTELLESRADVIGPMVDGAVDAEIVDEPAALLVGSGDPDHAAAEKLGDLHRDRARAAGGRGDHDG